MKILLVQQGDWLRKRLAKEIQDHLKVNVFATDNLREAAKACKKKGRFCVVVASHSHGHNGMRFIRALQKARPETGTVLLGSWPYIYKEIADSIVEPHKTTKEITEAIIIAKMAAELRLKKASD